MSEEVEMTPDQVREVIADIDEYVAGLPTTKFDDGKLSLKQRAQLRASMSKLRDHLEERLKLYEAGDE